MPLVYFLIYRLKNSKEKTNIINKFGRKAEISVTVINLQPCESVKNEKPCVVKCLMSNMEVYYQSGLH